MPLSASTLQPCYSLLYPHPVLKQKNNIKRQVRIKSGHKSQYRPVFNRLHNIHFTQNKSCL
jgi:hypothetical protein